MTHVKTLYYEDTIEQFEAFKLLRKLGFHVINDIQYHIIEVYVKGEENEIVYA